MSIDIGVTINSPSTRQLGTDEDTLKQTSVYIFSNIKLIYFQHQDIIYLCISMAFIKNEFTEHLATLLHFVNELQTFEVNNSHLLLHSYTYIYTTCILYTHTIKFSNLDFNTNKLFKKNIFFKTAQ